MDYQIPGRIRDTRGYCGVRKKVFSYIYRFPLAIMLVILVPCIVCSIVLVVGQGADATRLKVDTTWEQFQVDDDPSTNRWNAYNSIHAISYKEYQPPKYKPLRTPHRVLDHNTHLSEPGQTWPGQTGPGLSGSSAADSSAVGNGHHRHLAADYILQYRKAATLTLLYQAIGDNKNLLTPKIIEKINSIEKKISLHPDYTSYCMNYDDGPYKGMCVAPSSINTYLHPSVEGGSYVFDGRGPLVSNFNNSLQNILLAGRAGFTDRSTSARNLASTSLISTFKFGIPLTKYSEHGEITNPNYQRQLCNEFIGRYDKMLQEESEIAQKDFGFQVLRYGGTIVDDEILSTLTRDMYTSFISLLFVGLFVVYHTRDLLLTIVGLLGVLLSFPPVVLIIRNLYGPKFNMMTVISVWVILGIGADDIFIFVDTFKQAPKGPLVDRLTWTYRRAVTAMLVTSFTTAAAFFATGISKIFPLREFGTFMGLLVTFNYLLVITWFPACLVLVEKMRQIYPRAWYWCNCQCFCLCFRRNRNTIRQSLSNNNGTRESFASSVLDDDIDDVHGNDDIDIEVPSYSKKCLSGYHTCLFKIRWFVLIFFIVLLGVLASRIPLITAPHELPRLLPKTSNIEQLRLAKKSLACDDCANGVLHGDDQGGTHSGPKECPVAVCNGTWVAPTPVPATSPPSSPTTRRPTTQSPTTPPPSSSPPITPSPSTPPPTTPPPTTPPPTPPPTFPPSPTPRPSNAPTHSPTSPVTPSPTTEPPSSPPSNPPTNPNSPPTNPNSPPSNPPTNPNSPPTNPNAPPTNPNSPPTNPNSPPTNPNSPPTNPNAPPTNPNSPPSNPPTNPNSPPTNPNSPPTNPNSPPTNINSPPTNPNAPPTNPNSPTSNPPTNPNSPPTNPNSPPTNPNSPPTNPNSPPTNPNSPPTNPNSPPTNPNSPPTNPNSPPTILPPTTLPPTNQSPTNRVFTPSPTIKQKTRMPTMPTHFPTRSPILQAPTNLQTPVPTYSPTPPTPPTPPPTNAPLSADLSLDIYFLWGVEGTSESDNHTKVPDYDTTFDLSDPAAQKALADHCKALKINPLLRARYTSCFMDEYAKWAPTFPSPKNRFPVWIRSYLDLHRRYAQNVGFDQNANVRWFLASSKTYVDKDLDSQDMQKVYDEWEETMDNYNDASPSTLNKGVQFTYNYIRMSTEVAFISGTVRSIVVSSSLIGFAILVFTQNLWIMCYVMICILATVVSLLGCYEIWGWSFGVVEALCSSLVTGLAVDYALHVGHAYNHAHHSRGTTGGEFHILGNGDNNKIGRRELTKVALLSVGPSVVAAAATSIFSMIVLQFCEIQIFQKVGLVIATTLGVGLVYSLVLFIVILMCVGPVGDSGNIVAMFRKCFGRRRGIAGSNIDPLEANFTAAPREMSKIN